MDSFEQLIGEILWNDGYWVKTSVKVELTKAQKVEIGRPSSPRWELDIIGYQGGMNVLKVIECKSYLDSRGVAASAFDGSNAKFADRFKLFHNEILRTVVFDQLKTQLVAKGWCREGLELRLCLACGRIASERDRGWLRGHFKEKGWELWDEEWLAAKLQDLANGGYENNVSSVVTKLLLRKRRPSVAPPPLE